MMQSRAESRQQLAQATCSTDKQGLKRHIAHRNAQAAGARRGRARRQAVALAVALAASVGHIDKALVARLREDAVAAVVTLAAAILRGKLALAAGVGEDAVAVVVTLAAPVCHCDRALVAHTCSGCHEPCAAVVELTMATCKPLKQLEILHSGLTGR